MAKRPKQQTLFNLALTGSWEVSATYVAALSFFYFAVIPLVTNPTLQIIASVLKPLCIVLIGVFSFLAMSKLLKRHNSNQPDPSGDGKDANAPSGNSSTSGDNSVPENPDEELK